MLHTILRSDDPESVDHHGTHDLEYVFLLHTSEDRLG